MDIALRLRIYSFLNDYTIFKKVCGISKKERIATLDSKIVGAGREVCIDISDTTRCIMDDQTLFLNSDRDKQKQKELSILHFLVKFPQKIQITFGKNMESKDEELCERQEKYTIKVIKKIIKLRYDLLEQGHFSLNLITSRLNIFAELPNIDKLQFGSLHVKLHDSVENRIIDLTKIVSVSKNVKIQKCGKLYLDNEYTDFPFMTEKLEISDCKVFKMKYVQFEKMHELKISKTCFNQEILFYKSFHEMFQLDTLHKLKLEFLGYPPKTFNSKEEYAIFSSYLQKMSNLKQFDLKLKDDLEFYKFSEKVPPSVTKLSASIGSMSINLSHLLLSQMTEKKTSTKFKIQSLLVDAIVPGMLGFPIPLAEQDNLEHQKVFKNFKAVTCVVDHNKYSGSDANKKRDLAFHRLINGHKKCQRKIKNPDKEKKFMQQAFTLKIVISDIRNDHKLDIECDEVALFLGWTNQAIDEEDEPPKPKKKVEQVFEIPKRTRARREIYS